MEPNELRAQGRAALEAGDHGAALAAHAELVRMAPADHRARFAAARSLVALGERERAVTAYHAAAEGLLRRDYLLSAIAACKLALLVNPVEKRLKDTLRRVHARASASAPGRAQVPPPLPPETLVEETGRGSLLGLSGSRLSDRAHEILGRPDEESPPADPGARPPLPLFADLDREAFVDLVQKMAYREYRAGDRVVAEGDRGDSVFVLVAGKASVGKAEAGAGALATLPGGALFGEMALLAGSPRTATVDALVDTEAFEITRGVLDELARSHEGVPQALAEFGRRRLVQNLLATSTIFKPLSHEERWEVWGRFGSKVYKPGESIIVEGQDPGGLFLVVTGEVEVSKADTGGDRVVLAYLREGEVLGEISLVKERGATATVKATRKTVAAYLPRPAFQGLADVHPELLAYLENVTEERLRSTAQALAPSEILDASELLV